jgi:hypothetical protein
MKKMIDYTLKVNGNIEEYISAFSPIGALKAYCMANADDCFSFRADLIALQSSRKLHVFRNLEYYADCDEIYCDK